MLLKCLRTNWTSPRNLRCYSDSSPHVLFRIEDGIGKITLNNPGKRNALSLQTLTSLNNTLTELNNSTQVVIISSVGPVFSSGHDLRDFHGTDAKYQQEVIELCSKVNQKLRSLPQPVIAVVNGLATAAGCQLACSADLLFASTISKFSVPGVLSGRFCHTPGVAVAEKLHPKKAFQLLMLGDELNAEEAYQYGLVNKVFEPEEIEEQAERIAQKIITRGGTNLQEGKKCFYEQISAPTLEKKYEVANKYMLDMFTSPSCQSSISDFFEKKKPKH